MQTFKQVIKFLSVVMAEIIGKGQLFFNVTLRHRIIARLEMILLNLKTEDEIRFDRAWQFMTPAERRALQHAKGQGLLSLRQQFIDKYIDEEGNPRNEFFTNR